MGPNRKTGDHVSVQIDAKLNGLTPTPPERCIFEVHYQLRSVNEKAYKPEMLAIGPYHRGKNRLQVMEEQKLRYLKRLLERRKESSVEKYVRVLRGLEERARNCYGETISLSVDESVEMMLLDGCFIIGLFRKYAMQEQRDVCDPIFNIDWICVCLVRDTMLLENQLPFFVLCQLFDMISDPELNYYLKDIALHFFSCPLPSPGSLKDLRENSTYEIKHLLGLAHNHIVSSFALIRNTRDVEGDKDKLTFIHCATELVEAGVKFRRVDKRNLFDIRLKNGVLEFPPLRIEDQTVLFSKPYCV